MAREWDGVDDLITVTPSASQGGITLFSFAAWIYVQSMGEGSVGTLFRGEDGGVFSYQLRTENSFGNNVLRWVVSFSTGNGGWHPNYIISDNFDKWIHFGFSYDSGATTNDAVFYIDGSNVGLINDTTPPSGTWNKVVDALYIGNDAAGARTYDGYMAEFAMWDRLLTASEFASLGKGYSPLFYPQTLMMYFPFIGRVSPEPELMQGSNGTLTTGTNQIAHPRIIYPYGDPTGVKIPTPKEIKKYVR